MSFVEFLDRHIGKLLVSACVIAFFIACAFGK